MSNQHKGERDERALDALLVSQLRIDEVDNGSSEHLPQLSDADEAAITSLGDDLVDRLLAGETGPAFDRFDKGEKYFDQVEDDCTELIGAGPSGLNRAVELDEETTAELDRRREAIIANARKKQHGNQVDPTVIETATNVLKTLGMWQLPVDPEAIAREEGIQLEPGSYGPDFDARIEYLPAARKFVIYYAEPSSERSNGRVRFSLCHELAHYYLAHHRELLLSGQTHDSVVDYHSSDPLEREADEFAASLLMPKELFRKEVGNFSQRVCDISDICRLAADRVQASITSTARRYCESDVEACSVVFSVDGYVRWAIHSEGMRRMGMGYIQFGNRIPRQSRTSSVWTEGDISACAEVIKGTVEPSVWYERPRCEGMLWEEAMPLGSTGVVLTLLVLGDQSE